MSAQDYKAKLVRKLGKIVLVVLLIYIVLSGIGAFPFSNLLFRPPELPGGMPSLVMAGAEKVREEWIAKDSVQVEMLAVTSTAGPAPIKLSAWWVFKDSCKSKPTIIFLAGNGGLKPASFEDEIQLMTGLGFNCLLLDQRGYGASAGELLTYGWFERGDFDAVVDTLVQRRGIDKKRIGIWGFSMGASNAVCIAASHPEISAVLLYAPWSDPIPMAVHYIRGSFSIPKFLLYLPVRLAVEAGLLKTKAKILDPAREAKKVRGRAVVVHGDADDVTPPELTDLLYNSLAGPKELVVVPGAHHNDLIKTMGPERYLKQMKEFFGPLAAPPPEFQNGGK